MNIPNITGVGAYLIITLFSSVTSIEVTPVVLRRTPLEGVLATRVSGSDYGLPFHFIHHFVLHYIVPISAYMNTLPRDTE